MENKNIFITGATGFIGENLALQLAEKNRVFALVRRESVKKAAYLQGKGVEILPGDLLNSSSYSEKLNGIDYVFHLAALCKLDAPKKLLYKYNVSGTEKLLESCRGKDIRKIIHFSTAYVFGTKEKNSIAEEEPYPERFKNWYEWSKAEGEKAALGFYKRYNLPIVILRPAVVYGPGSFWGLYDVLSLISKGNLWLIPGSGRNKVHLVHVDDVVQSAVHLAEITQTNGEIYHICDDNQYTCSDLIKILCKELGARLPSAHLPRFLAATLIRIPFLRPLFSGISPQLLDYFLYNQSYSNKKLKDSNYLLKHPTPIRDLKLVVEWYRTNRYLS